MPPPTASTSGFGPAAAAPPINPPSRCSLPGYKKSQREAQDRELGAGGAVAPPPPVAARATAFTLAFDSISESVMDMLREVGEEGVTEKGVEGVLAWWVLAPRLTLLGAAERVPLRARPVPLVQVPTALPPVRQPLASHSTQHPSSSPVMSSLAQVDPDVQARMLDKWAQHNRELRGQANQHG